MKLKLTKIPRKFKTDDLVLKDYGKILLKEKEMVSFQTPSGKENDVTAYSWGFYLANSLNGRLKNNGFKAALIIGEKKRIYITIVDVDKMDEFKQYLKKYNYVVLTWLDEWAEPQ